MLIIILLIFLILLLFLRFFFIAYYSLDVNTEAAIKLTSIHPFVSH